MIWIGLMYGYIRGEREKGRSFIPALRFVEVDGNIADCCEWLHF